MISHYLKRWVYFALCGLLMACGGQPTEDLDPAPSNSGSAAISHFVVAGISSATDIGVAESVTVTAYDTNGEVKTDYTGTIQFSSDDPLATLPSNYSFGAGDSGVKVFTDEVIFGTVGTYLVEAEDSSDSSIDGEQNSIVVTNTQCPGRTVGFQLANSSSSEANTSRDFTVELSAVCANDVTVDYSSSDGSAEEPGDYSALSGTLTIAAGTTTQSVSLTVVDDGDVESTEDLSITLSNNGQSTSLGAATHTYSILDDDSPPVCPTSTIGFQASSSSGDESVTAVNLVVELSQTCTADVSVDYTTSDLLAEAGSDYTAASGTVTVLAGQTTATIPLTVADDGDGEATENFKVTLSNAGPLDASLGLSVHTYSITDNDGGPAPCPLAIGFSTNSSNGLESITTRNFTVALNGTCTRDITVDYATSDMTAIKPNDYAQEMGTVTVLAGQTTANFDIAVVDDGDTESDESFKLTLSNPNLAEVTLATSVHTAVIVDDDDATNHYYVRTSGNDASDGLSPATAWATIGKAAATMVAGDTVFVGGGTYAENVVPTSGGAGNPITYIGDEDGVNTGDAGEVIINTTGTLINFTNVSNVIFDRFSLTGGSMGVYGFGTSSNLTIRNCKFSSMNYAMIIWQVDGLYIEHNTFTGMATIGILAYSGSNNVEIKNNLFDASAYGVYLGANVPSTLIENNTFFGNTVVQVYMQSNVTATIKNNIITNGGTGLWDATNNSTVTNSNNNVWNNTTDYLNVTEGAGRVDADPKFTDTANDDFSVDPTSPTIDAGSANASTVGFADGSDLTARGTRNDSVKDGDTGNGDGNTVNLGYHY